MNKLTKEFLRIGSEEARDMADADLDRIRNNRDLSEAELWRTEMEAWRARYYLLVEHYAKAAALNSPDVFQAKD